MPKIICLSQGKTKESIVHMALSLISFAATMIMIVGGLTIITAAVMRNSFGAMMVMLGYLFISIIVALIYAHKVYKKEIDEGR